MPDRLRVILLAIIGGIVAFGFATMMFFPALTPQRAYDAFLRFFLRRSAIATVAFGDTVGFLEGESLAFDDGMVVTFTGIEDSRCQRGVQCVTPGDLVVNLGVKHGRSSSTPGAKTPLNIGFLKPEGSVPPYSFTLVDFTEGALTFTVTVDK